MSDSVCINITYTQEISDHDGYCSGNECEYRIDHLNILTSIRRSDIKLDNKGNIIDLQSFHRYVPIPEVNGGSYYCGNSDEAEDHGLDIHDYKITIINVEFV